MDPHLPKEPENLIIDVQPQNNPPVNPQDTPQTPVAPPPPPAKPRVFPKKAIIIFTILSLLVLVLIAFGVFFAVNQKKNTSTSTPSPLALPTLEPTPTATPSIDSTPSPIAIPTPGPNSQVLTLTPKGTSDAFFSSNGTGNSTSDLRIGRNTYAITRSFLSFDLSTLPKNAVIQGAILRVYQASVSGNPYTIGASLKVDHMDLGPTLEAEDYSLPALQSDFATVTSDTNIEWKEVVVTEQVRFDAQSSRLLSQYRLHLTKELIGGQAGGDFTHFESSENFAGTGNTPELVITYNLQ